jgi:hypothetical protein
MFASKDLLFSAEKYNVSRSLRLRASASAYLNRTPSSATNRTTWTLSLWVKKGLITANSPTFTAIQDDNNRTTFAFGSAADNITIANVVASVSTTLFTSTAVYRDPSAWYHCVVKLDTTQATAADRLRVYVNGAEITGTFSYPAQNATLFVNSNVAHWFGRNVNTSPSYFDGYLAEINLIDGQALTPSSFGFYDNFGVWQPKGYTGAYGTNGFYLNFSDNSAATAAAIGKDYSGNGNNFTPNNISVTAGVTYDSMIDSPTNYTDGGNGRGNYCVLNGVDRNISTAPTTISNGNLQTTNTYSSVNYGAVAGTLGTSSGKWYFEGINTINAGIGNTAALGLTSSTSSAANAVSILGSTLSQFIGAAPSVSVNSVVFRTVGYTTSLANNTTLFASYASNDIINIAIDLDAGKLWIGKNGGWYNSGDPATGTTPTTTFTNPGGVWRPWVETAANTTNTNISSVIVNFGQRPFSYTPPSGFSALNTQSLTTPTIPNGAQYMAATLYTGNGGTNAVTISSSNSGNNPLGTTFQPDFLWGKVRSITGSHILVNSVVGATSYLSTNNTNAEATSATVVASLDTSGFTLGSNANINTNLSTNVAWLWSKGVTQGFDIVTYTGNGANRTISHSLNAIPSMMIVKQRTASSTTNWAVYHSSLANTEYILLNTSAAKATGATYWNSATPTASVFSLGTAADVNTNTGTYVNYLFTAIAGYSDFGSYTGNGSANGPFIYTGFRPRWVLIKCSSAATTNWRILDTSRDTYNVESAELYPNLSNAEGAFDSLDALSNGFKIRNTNASYNTSAATYVYAAFAENPFKISRAR